MKYFASILIVILIFGFIIGTQGCFDAISFMAEKEVLAYQDNKLENNVQAKPIDIISNDTGKKGEINLRLMTYNIHRGISKSGKLDLDSTAAVINGANPGIVALQEVERHSIRTGFKDQIRYLASKLGMNYAYGKSLNILTGEYGNGVLSKYPIEEYKIYDLPSVKEQRTVLRAVINIEGHRLAVYNVHLGLNQTEREEQVNYITQLLSSEKLDYVLMGDMNTSADKLSRITKIMKDSSTGSVEYNQSTIEDKELRARIDYIFLSQKMKATGYNVIISYVSDHYPVASEVKVLK